MKDTFHTVCVLATMLLTVPAVWAGDEPAQDTDRDGLSDQVEADLGTDPNLAEKFVALGTFPASAAKAPELDLVRVEFANVAQDRWLWAIRFAQAYRFDNASLIVYLDADNDPATGRKDMGCEVMLSHDRGRPGVTAFAPDGSNVSAPLPRVALVDGVLYVCHDGAIKQDGEHTTFRFTVLSETREPHAGVDSTGWTDAAGPPNSDRPKVLLLDDITANENFEQTEGLDLVWQLRTDPANVVISSVGAELQNMAYYDAEYRWPAVRGADGTITVTVPKAGRFYPAVVVYDTGGREAYELIVDGRRVGRFLAAEDDNRQRIHFLSQPLEFRGGEKLTFRTGTVGSHITEDILLLAAKPPVRGRKFELSPVEWGLVGVDGRPHVRLTWITTWPAACTVEYGPTTEYGQKFVEQQPVANHRVFLPAPGSGSTVHFRIAAARPDGERVVSPDAEFMCAPPQPTLGTAELSRVPLAVENPYDFPAASFPVTNGVPFAKGELGDERRVRLLDEQGRSVPLQTHVAVRWADESIKWLRTSFLASAAAKSTAKYTLEYGTRILLPGWETPEDTSLPDAKSKASVLKIGGGQNIALSLDTGPLQVQFGAQGPGFPTRICFDANGDGRCDDRDPSWGEIVAEVTDSEGRRFASRARTEQVELEESGPVRAVVKVTGRHHGEGTNAMFAFVNRFTFYAGSPLVRMQYTWINDSESTAMTRFEQIALRLPWSASQRQWSAGVGGKHVLTGTGDVSLRQLHDTGCEFEFNITSLTASSSTLPDDLDKQRADGWLDVADDRAGLTVAVRDFWQLYPKGFRVNRDGVFVDLCPDFPTGTYDGCSKLDEIKLYYYLMGGKYKVAQGVQKQHEIMLYFHPDTKVEAPLRDANPVSERPAHHGPLPVHIARAFQEPLIAACPPERYCDTRVFGDILPATAGRSAEYEAVCERVYQNYVSHRERSHEYGMLNFGDQWGERRVNWANGEYDHHHAFLMQFIRTGDRKWYFLGQKAARHAIDVDTCHYGPHRGGEWIHSMGHTGGYFRESYEGDGIPGPGMSVSHTWTEGFYDWYVLSGDPTGAENAALVADYYGGAYLNNYDWGNCRTNGWHLLLTMAAYRATNDPFYLNAARIIVERTLERQSPGGGWQRQMVPGHCHDMPRHRGEANFVLGVLANGLEEYYREVPDPRVARAIIGGAKQAVHELWVPESDGFRYTSCPNMTGYTANNDMTSEILFFAHRLGGDPQFAEIAMRAMRAAFRDGIGSIAHLRWTPHIVYNMDLLQKSPAPP